MNINQLAYQYFGGVDLMAIEGVSHATVMTIMSEVGLEGFSKFETFKQFTSWLYLSPNTKITGVNPSAVTYQKVAADKRLH